MEAARANAEDFDDDSAAEAIAAATRRAEAAERLADEAKDEVPNLKKIGRNDACPCGSGKKYKHCHGKVASG